MTTQAEAFDPIKFKETTCEQWENVAEAWYRWGRTLQTWLGPVTEVMLDLGRVGPGDRALDVAAGAGEPALADIVGPEGTGAVLVGTLTVQAVGEVQTNGQRTPKFLVKDRETV